MDDQLTFDGYVTKNFDFDVGVREAFKENIYDIDTGDVSLDRPDIVPEQGTMSILKKIELKKKIIDV